MQTLIFTSLHTPELKAFVKQNLLNPIKIEIEEEIVKKIVFFVFVNYSQKKKFSDTFTLVLENED